MIRRFGVLAIFVVCQPAHAWQVLVQVSCETTIRGSSETSTAATRADDGEGRAKGKTERTDDGRGAIEGSQCMQDDECAGWCRENRCVDNLTPVAAPVPAPVPVPVPVPIPKECELDEHCAAGRACQNFQCIDVPPVVAPPTPAACSSDAECQPGQSCSNGHCLSLPPSPPSSSLQRRGSELYLRERVVQLKQDLALGEGPVISTLASVRGCSPIALGRVLRAHRAELIELMGDGSDPGWMSRFLLRLDALGTA